MTSPFQCAPDFAGDMTRQEWTLVDAFLEHNGSDVVDALGAVLDYARHHNMSQHTIDHLADWHNKAASVCLRAPNAIQDFIDELAARDPQPRYAVKGHRGQLVHLVPDKAVQLRHEIIWLAAAPSVKVCNQIGPRP